MAWFLRPWLLSPGRASPKPPYVLPLSLSLSLSPQQALQARARSGEMRAVLAAAAGTTVLGDVNLAATLLNNLTFFLGTFTFALILGVITDEVSTR